MATMDEQKERDRIRQYLEARGEEVTEEEIEHIIGRESGGYRYIDEFGQRWGRPPGFPPGMEFRMSDWGAYH